MRRGWRVAVSIGLLGTAVSAAAAGPELQIAVTVEREVRRTDGSGTTRVERHAVSRAEPGDVLVHTLHYRNAGDVPAAGAVLAEPVPAGTAIVRGSAVAPGAAVQYSIDGKSWSGWPQVERATLAGTSEEVDAPPAAVRSVRFVLHDAVPAGGTGSASCWAESRPIAAINW